jgi:GTP-binding protein Era
MGEEVPYSVSVEVDSMEERENGKLVITARILTTEEKYKRMLIGAQGRKIKEMGSSARKELQAATNKNIYLDLNVEVDPHWVQRLGQ